MRRVGSPRHDVTVRPFRNFGVSSSRGIGSVYSIYILIERHPFIQRHEIYELPRNVLHINKLRLSTIVHGWSQQRYSFACPDRRMCQSQLAFCSRDYWIVSLQNSFDRLPSIVPFHGDVRLLLRSIISKIMATRQVDQNVKTYKSKMIIYSWSSLILAAEHYDWCWILHFNLRGIDKCCSYTEIMLNYDKRRLLLYIEHELNKTIFRRRSLDPC